jgi:hypothetical protein
MNQGLKNSKRVERQPRGSPTNTSHRRAAVVPRLLAPGTDVKALLQSAEACVVTKKEHQLIASATGVLGWRRYVTAGIHPIDLVTRSPMDLDSAVATDELTWADDGT